jgi:GNAT superfamily N-acetyltransferase
MDPYTQLREQLKTYPGGAVLLTMRIDVDGAMSENYRKQAREKFAQLHEATLRLYAQVQLIEMRTNIPQDAKVKHKHKVHKKFNQDYAAIGLKRKHIGMMKVDDLREEPTPEESALLNAELEKWRRKLLHNMIEIHNRSEKIGEHQFVVHALDRADNVILWFDLRANRDCSNARAYARIFLDHIELDSIDAFPKRRGHGTRLLKLIVDHCRTRGVRSVVGTVLNGAPHLRKWYADQGFTVWKRTSDGVWCFCKNL